MNNVTNWLLAIIIVLLMGGGVYWIYSNQNPGYSSVDTTNAGSSDTSTTSSGETVTNLTEPVSDKDWTIGPENAKIQLVEYADYQCPACKQLSPVFKQIAEKYPDDVSFTFRHYPLNYHELARDGAMIAEASGAQGKFWEMHEFLFSSGYTSLENAYKKATELGLDADKLKSEVESGKYAEKVDGDFQSGSDSGVGGTPTMFMNGKSLVWEKTIDLENTIKAELGGL